MKKMIEITEAVKQYGDFRALKGISLEIDQGEFIAIMGPSGSGKTTLLNIMSSIDQVTSGKIVIDGADISSINEKQMAQFRRDKIGFVFQAFNLLDNMNVRDNIALPLALNREKSGVITEKTEELAKLLGIYEKLDLYPYELSGGQKQRAAICRALISSPSIIFADEPTGALDSKSSSEVLVCFKNINQKFGTTIVMVTHDPVAASYCDRIMFLKDGKFHARLDSSGSKKDLFQKTLNMLSMLGGSSNELF